MRHTLSIGLIVALALSIAGGTYGAYLGDRGLMFALCIGPIGVFAIAIHVWQEQLDTYIKAKRISAQRAAKHKLLARYHRQQGAK